MATAVVLVDDVVHWQQILPVVLSGWALLLLLLAWGALLGRWLPAWLAPLVAAPSAYLLYVPATLSNGEGWASHLAVMDDVPAPERVVDAGAWVGFSLAAVAVAGLAVVVAGARTSWRAVGAAAALAAAAAVPLAQTPGSAQSVVFFDESARPVCAHREGPAGAARPDLLTCVHPTEKARLATLVAAAERVDELLAGVGVPPRPVGTSGALTGAEGVRAREVAPVVLAQGEAAAAASIVQGAFITDCERPTVRSGTQWVWEDTLAAWYLQSIGVRDSSLDGDTDGLAELAALDDAHRTARLSALYRATQACRGEAQ